MLSIGHASGNQHNRWSILDANVEYGNIPCGRGSTKLPGAPVVAKSENSDSIPDRPARSQSLYRLSYPAHATHKKYRQKYNSVVIQLFVWSVRKNCEQRPLVSSCLSVCFARTNSTHTGQIFVRFNFCDSFETPKRKFKHHLISDKNNGYFTWWPVYIYDNIWLISSWNEKCFRQKFEKNDNTLLISSLYLSMQIVPFLSKCV